MRRDEGKGGSGRCLERVEGREGRCREGRWKGDGREREERRWREVRRDERSIFLVRSGDVYHLGPRISIVWDDVR